MKTLEQKFREKFIEGTPDECWNWNASLDSRGYGHISGGRKGKQQRAHRVAWRLSRGVESKQYVLHKCDNKRCVNPAHLFEGTHRVNMEDMSQKERHGFAKFSHVQVERLRVMYQKHKGHLTQKRMSDWFGVSKQTMSDLLKGELRKFASGPTEAEDMRRKLTKAQREEVKLRYGMGENQASLARHFSVNRHTIGTIIRTA